MAAFGDLNLPTVVSRTELRERVVRARQLGYKQVAINTTVTGNLSPAQHKCTFQAFDFDEKEKAENSSTSLRFGNQPFKQYSRITVVLDSTNQMHSLNPSSPVIKSYDIFAIQPMTEKLFQQACSAPLEVDIIVLSQAEKQCFPLRVPTIKMAIERGIYFEISYSFLLENSHTSRFAMANALNLVRVTKGKNILITSGSKSRHELRSPYDVAALARLFGLDYQKSQDSLSLSCSRVLHHAYTRTTHKTVIGAVTLEEILAGDKTWKLDQEDESLALGLVGRHPFSLPPSHLCREMLPTESK